MLLSEALVRGRGGMPVGDVVETVELADLLDQVWYGDIGDLESMVTGGSESGMKPAIVVEVVGGGGVVDRGEEAGIYELLGVGGQVSWGHSVRDFVS